MKRYMLLMLLAGLVVGVWLSRESSNVSNTPPDGDPSKRAIIGTALPVASDDPSQLNTTSHPDQSGTAQDQGPMEHPDGHQSEEVIQAVLAQNVPIEFYGKVVDQYNNPVSGAEVLLKWREGIHVRPDMTSGADKPVTLVSNEDGRFELTGKTGIGVSIEAIKKEGYQLSEHINRYFPYNTETPAPDPAKPALFKIWKKQGADRLIIEEKKHSLIPDGRQYTFDFLDNNKTEGAQATGDIIVSVKRPEVVELKKGFSWTFTLDAIGGGVLESSDEIMNLAPESGYEPHYEAQMTPTDNVNQRKQFYVLSRDGKTYSRIQVFVNPVVGDKAVFEIKSFVNPTGSRNLELDPSQFTSTDDHFPPQ